MVLEPPLLVLRLERQWLVPERRWLVLESLRPESLRLVLERPLLVLVPLRPLLVLVPPPLVSLLLVPLSLEPRELVLVPQWLVLGPEPGLLVLEQQLQRQLRRGRQRPGL